MVIEEWTTDRAEWERGLKEQLRFAVMTGTRVDEWGLPVSLTGVPGEKLVAEVLRRGDKLDLGGVLARVPDGRLYAELSGRIPLRLDLSDIAEAVLLHELDRRGKLPRLDLSAAGDAELYRELGRRRQARRKVRCGGRPPKPRCACGKLTQDAGRKRGHVCGDELEANGYSVLRTPLG
jgi:hypothetical protein